MSARTFWVTFTLTGCTSRTVEVEADTMSAALREARERLTYSERRCVVSTDVEEIEPDVCDDDEPGEPDYERCAALRHRHFGR